MSGETWRDPNLAPYQPTAQEVATRCLEEKRLAQEEGREPFTIAITPHERDSMIAFFGAGTPGRPDVWPNRIAGVPVQVVDVLQAGIRLE